ncbi:hypothetical protein [Actinokineospora globicatena]|uniref:hypothetical protein n=1 Tax=Actinokineospora globicatena TaxID=103729 RepID=UPI0020A596B9|nr:hypothetical protein [Actinokineospora globicatena]MCP2303489.1 hypothetical protein [Actinokineospora globicatena]GLW79377.1 hypothetical protein Aglo01_38590 [Actinokineospora globicatena]GLW86213.1 hypothetical protein Aglo02_38520 [Actinokineospora globicatena]
MDIWSGDESGLDGGDTGAEGFAGELFLKLADAGWLVVEPEVGLRVITQLQQTLDAVRDRVRLAEVSRRLRDTAGDDLAPEVDQAVVDSVFAEQITAGRWEQALVELPKYIEAFRRAAGLPEP